MALHGCHEANRDVVVGAMRVGALWAVLPCCIRQKLYLPDCSVAVDDETRHLLLCGAFANEYGAQLVRTIDRRITARHVMIAGGLDRPTAENEPTAGLLPGDSPRSDDSGKRGFHAKKLQRPRKMPG